MDELSAAGTRRVHAAPPRGPEHRGDRPDARPADQRGQARGVQGGQEAARGAGAAARTGRTERSVSTARTTISSFTTTATPRRPPTSRRTLTICAELPRARRGSGRRRCEMAVFPEMPDPGEHYGARVVAPAGAAARAAPAAAGSTITPDRRRCRWRPRPRCCSRSASWPVEVFRTRHRAADAGGDRRRRSAPGAADVGGRSPGALGPRADRHHERIRGRRHLRRTAVGRRSHLRQPVLSAGCRRQRRTVGGGRARRARACAARHRAQSHPT